MRKHLRATCMLTSQLLFYITMSAQDLDPRSYARVPIGLTTLVGRFSYSYGGVVSEPTLPIQNIEAVVQTSSIAVACSFSFFKLTSQALVVLPFSFAQVSGQVGNQSLSITRTGFSDA